jgi:hypothetical protein
MGFGRLLFVGVWGVRMGVVGVYDGISWVGRVEGFEKEGGRGSLRPLRS